jgi:FkbM family methyltransferase
LMGNLALNPGIQQRVTVVPNPVSDSSGTKLFYRDNGPGSSVRLEAFEGQDGEVESLSIDDFVESNGLEKLDFIKMDIEGAEMAALKGAEKSLRKFQPKLAIAIYHSWADMAQIPKWIDELKLNYEFFLGHYTIHQEETVLFARPKQ